MRLALAQSRRSSLLFAAASSWGPRPQILACVSAKFSVGEFDGHALGGAGPRLSRVEFYQKLSRSMFGLGLPGLGYDCFRNWELMTIGTIVVLERGVGLERMVSILCLGYCISGVLPLVSCLSFVCSTVSAVNRISMYHPTLKRPLTLIHNPPCCIYITPPPPPPPFSDVPPPCPVPRRLRRAHPRPAAPSIRRSSLPRRRVRVRETETVLVVRIPW
jgi:hypothetical protein